MGSGAWNGEQTVHESVLLDRRRSARFEMDARLVARLSNDPGRAIQGRVVDLSCAGVSALIAADFQIGEVLELEWGLPYTSDMVRLDAAIRSRDGYRYGMQFVCVIPADQEKIKRSCAALASRA